MTAPHEAQPLLPPSPAPRSHRGGMTFARLAADASTVRRRRALRVLVLVLPVVASLLVALQTSRESHIVAPHRAQYRYRPRGAADPYAVAAPLPHQLRVLTLNSFMRPWPVGLTDYQLERTPALLDALADCDIACSQEIFWASGRKDHILRALGKRGFAYSATAPIPGFNAFRYLPPRIIDAGLTITSKFPIVDTDFEVFDDVVQSSIDALVEKGVLYANIALPANSENSSTSATGAAHATPNRCLHVFSLHAQADNGMDIHDFVRVREKQMAQLVRFVQRKTLPPAPQCPVVIGGDFNINGRAAPHNASSSKEYSESLRANLDHIPDIIDVLYQAHNHTHPVTSAGGLDGSTQKNERLDYVFFAPSSTNPNFAINLNRPARVRPFWTSDSDPRPPFLSASDHFGVEASFVY